eukprot:4933074-Heterocapsa_arctica.AAC.1
MGLPSRVFAKIWKPLMLTWSLLPSLMLESWSVSASCRMDVPTPDSYNVSSKRSTEYPVNSWS